MEKGTCDRIWLLYLQGRLSPAQLLALCKLSADDRDDDSRHQQSSAA
ncbi:hypothetical protein [Leptothoe spongobia]|uniref:Uncharacterized protein n=1 Tax=Leptothoe spongobia TAU-MAC 1115 TaxID=1967444 RepID=A0A947DGX6_9CYAN|nr:hypothetical protein [Leptothoe spongobia]MBT9316847.1 hypothetical protein [Leptothoe spongobia TAU-MAC 1115]